jgi:hypothetical protein
VAEGVADCALCLRAAGAALYRGKVLGRDRRVGYAAVTAGAHGSRREIAELEAQGVLVQIEGPSKEPGSIQSATPRSSVTMPSHVRWRHAAMLQELRIWTRTVAIISTGRRHVSRLNQCAPTTSRVKLPGTGMRQPWALRRLLSMAEER